jgi:hypothetical protein
MLMIFPITIAHNVSIAVVDRLDAFQTGDRRKRDTVEGEGVVEHKVGLFVGPNEPTVGGSTPVEVVPLLWQTDLVGLAGVDEVPELAAPIGTGGKNPYGPSSCGLLVRLPNRDQ